MQRSRAGDAEGQLRFDLVRGDEQQGHGRSVPGHADTAQRWQVGRLRNTLLGQGQGAPGDTHERSGGHPRREGAEIHHRFHGYGRRAGERHSIDDFTERIDRAHGKAGSADFAAQVMMHGEAAGGNGGAIDVVQDATAAGDHRHRAIAGRDDCIASTS